MPKINFRKLIQVAPFDRETKKEILAKEKDLTRAQKYEITALAWRLLTKDYKNKLAERVDLALLEMAQAKKDYTQSDFAEMQAELYMDFAKKLEVSENAEGIQEVREELQKHLRQPAEKPTSPPTPSPS